MLNVKLSPRLETRAKRRFVCLSDVPPGKCLQAAKKKLIWWNCWSTEFKSQQHKLSLSVSLKKIKNKPLELNLNVEKKKKATLTISHTLGTTEGVLQPNSLPAETEASWACSGAPRSSEAETLQTAGRASTSAAPPGWPGWEPWSQVSGRWRGPLQVTNTNTQCENMSSTLSDPQWKPDPLSVWSEWILCGQRSAIIF